MNRLGGVCHRERGRRPETRVSTTEPCAWLTYSLKRPSTSVPPGAELLDFLGTFSASGVYLSVFPEIID